MTQQTNFYTFADSKNAITSSKSNPDFGISLVHGSDVFGAHYLRAVSAKRQSIFCHRRNYCCDKELSVRNVAAGRSLAVLRKPLSRRRPFGKGPVAGDQSI